MIKQGIVPIAFIGVYVHPATTPIYAGGGAYRIMRKIL